MYCSKCGKELPEGSQFCPNCGNSVNAPAVPPQSRDSSGHDQDTPFSGQSNTPPEPQSSTPQVSNEEVRCPRCGAAGCTPQYKQNVSGGGYGCCSGGLGALVLGPLGLLCGACGRSTKTTNTLVWICPKCGHEFRVQSKQEAKTNYMAGCLMMLFCALAFDVFLAYAGHDFGWFKPLIIFISVIMAAEIAFIAYMRLYKKPLVKFTDEECQQLKNFTVVCIAITLALGFVVIAFA